MTDKLKLEEIIEIGKKVTAWSTHSHYGYRQYSGSYNEIDIWTSESHESGTRGRWLTYNVRTESQGIELGEYKLDFFESDKDQKISPKAFFEYVQSKYAGQVKLQESKAERKRGELIKRARALAR